jgi:phosphate-selective porin OprO/OprP
MVGQLDGRFSSDEPSPFNDTFYVRKARLSLSGRVAKYFEFKVMPDFGAGTSVLVDAYVDMRLSPSFRIRMGKDKTPIGYELLRSTVDLAFPERSLASSLVPNRDVGIELRGDLPNGKLSYAAGLFNGIVDGTNSSTDVDTNDGKDFAGRVVVRPFARTGSRSPLAGLGAHLGGSAGRQLGTLPSFKTTVGRTYFSYDAAAKADGVRTRLTPAVFYYYKSVGAFAEYIRSAQTIAREAVTTPIANHGWDVTGTFVLTGEAAGERNVKPAHPFEPDAHRWGALQLVARYSKLSIDPLAFTNGVAASSASPAARSFAIGADWLPVGVVKYYLMFERTTFSLGPGGARRPERSVIFRTQLAF